jgi:hypothetical protein
MKLLGRINANRFNFLLDTAMALAFVIVMEARFTGLHYHEILGVAIAVAFFVHIMLHRRWVIGITRQFFQIRRLLSEARFKYVVNLSVLVVLSVSIATGILISRTLGVVFLPDPGTYAYVLTLHVGTSRLSLLLIGLHIAVDWKWIVANARRHLSTSVLRRPRPTAAGGERSR